MPTAHVQTVTGDWSSGSTWTASITATTGNLLSVSVHFIAGNSGNSFATFSDGTNTYTEINRSEAVLGGENTGLVTGYAKNITGGALTVTATMNSSVMDRARLVVEEISGCDTTAPLNVHTIQHQISPGTGTDAVSSGAVTTSAGDYIYAACIDFFSGSPVLAHGTGFTDGMNAAIWATEYIANFAGGSKAGTFTTSSGTLDFFTAIASFKSAAGVTNYTLTASGGTYTETGTAAGLIFGHKVPASSGTYTETGTATTLRFGHKVPASSGTYSFTGTAAGLKYGHNLVSSSGTYSISGTAATLRCARKLAALSGTYSFTGSSAALDKGFTLSVSSGVYTLTGTAVGFKRTYAVAALTTSFDFVGSDVILTYSAAVIIPSDTGEHPDATEIENYFRRYANDRDVLCVPENLASETATVDEVSTDNHFESYVRRYGNDNV